MKKSLIVGAVVVLIALAGAAYFGAGLLARGADATVAGASSSTAAGQTGDPNQPERTAEIKGAVVSVDGTTIMVDRLLVDASAELTDEEKATRKAERQSMTMEQRQALKAAETAGVPTERVTVEIPVGVTITRMVPEGDTSVAKSGALSDIKAGATVTIWTDGATTGSSAEYVKIQAGN